MHRFSALARMCDHEPVLSLSGDWKDSGQNEESTSVDRDKRLWTKIYLFTKTQEQQSTTMDAGKEEPDCLSSQRTRESNT